MDEARDADVGEGGHAEADVARTSAREGYHHGDLARAALDAALAILELGGAEALTMRAVAGRLGVTHRALYRHFADREALLGACATAGYDQLSRAVGAAVDLKSYAEAYLRFALARPQLYAAMMRSHAGPRSVELDRGVHEVMARARAAIGGDRAVQRAWTILHGGLSLHAAGALRARDAEGLIAFLLTLLEET